MRIISKFHDYYDSVMRDDARDARCWVRKPRIELADIGHNGLPWDAEVPGRQNGGVCGERSIGTGLGWRKRAALDRACAAAGPEDAVAVRNASNSLDGAREALVLVAGKAHPVFVMGAGFLHFAQALRGCDPAESSRRLAQMTYPAAFDVPAHARDRAPVGGTAEDLVAEWKRCVGKALDRAAALGGGEAIAGLPGGSIGKFFDGIETRFYLGSMRWGTEARKSLAYEAALAEAEKRDWTDLHLRFGSPVLMLSRWRGNRGWGSNARAEAVTEVTVDPCLDMLRFSSRIDPFTLFQEVSMFVEGVMPDRSRDMVDLSDRSRVLKGGFDPVYGFRTRPHGKAGEGQAAHKCGRGAGS